MQTIDVVEQHGVNNRTIRRGRIRWTESQWLTVLGTKGTLTKRMAQRTGLFSRDVISRWGEYMAELDKQGLGEYDYRRGANVTEQGYAIFEMMQSPPPQMHLRRRERI